jgi:hypothetical protein
MTLNACGLDGQHTLHLAMRHPSSGRSGATRDVVLTPVCSPGSMTATSVPRQCNIRAQRYLCQRPVENACLHGVTARKPSAVMRREQLN